MHHIPIVAHKRPLSLQDETFVNLMPQLTVEACLLREIFIRYSSLLIMYTYAYTPMFRPLNPKILFQFLRPPNSPGPSARPSMAVGSFLFT